MSLQLEIIEKRYAQTSAPILSQVQLHAAAGEFIALIGPSGSGKSTLLNIVAGLDTQFTGRITIDQQPLHQRHATALRIGFMFQDARLMPWLTVLDNVLLVLGQMPDRMVRAEAMLNAVGLSDALHAFPSQLSGGMQRRVALARAFVVQPQLLLMDEPFISLDAPTVQQLHSLLLDLWSQQQPTVLFVTHTLLEALSLADRVLFFSHTPAHIIYQQTMQLVRPRLTADVNALAEWLLTEHPEMLAGVVKPTFCEL